MAMLFFVLAVAVLALTSLDDRIGSICVGWVTQGGQGKCVIFTKKTLPM